MTAMIGNKLRPPNFGAKLIERPRLWELLLKTESRQVIVLSAPAGYGKTILMVQLAEIMKKPLVWYQLDEYDNDPAVFLQYLVAGVEQHFPGFGKEVLQIIAQGKIETHLRLLTVAFTQSLNKQTKGDLIIVLDDYHLITTPAIHRLVQELLQQLPDNVQFIIASRMSLPFSLSRLTLSGKICHIGIEQLRYTGQEISSFFAKQNIELPETLLSQLEEKTAGWPAALHFLETSLTRIEDFLHNNEVQEIYDYLASEVFDRQPKEIQEFLEATSVLEVMTPDFCDVLLERSGSYQILESLAQQRLFLTPLAGKGHAYRYHQLFRDFLQSRLGRKRQTLLRRAAVIANKAGEAESAIQYLISAGCHEEAISIIREAGQQALGRGGWQTVAHWLTHLSVECVAADPWLSLYLATVEMHRGRLSEAKNWADRATNLFASVGNQTEVVASRLLKAQILRRSGRFLDSLEILEQILIQLTGFPSPLSLPITLEKSLCLLMTGQINGAETNLRSTIEMVKWNNDKYFMAHLLEGLGDLLYMQGDYHKALQTYQQAAELSPDRVLPSYYMQDSIATIYQDWGEFDKAFDYAKRNVDIKENLGLDEALPSVYIQLASLHADRREWQLAEEQYNRAIQLIRDNNGERFYLAINLIFLAQCLGLQGRWIEARVQAEAALMEAKQISGLALAVCRSLGSAIFAQTGSLREGAEMLQAAIADLERMKFKKAVCHAYAIQAWFYFHAGETEAMQTYARKVLQLAAEMSYLQIFLTYRDMFQPIVKYGMESSLEITFVHSILVRQGEEALAMLLELAAHSDSAVRQRTIAPLAEIGGTQAEAALLRLTADPDSEVRQIARLKAKRLDLPTGGESFIEAAEPVLQIDTLGPFRVLMQGDEISEANWRTLKTRDLLAYLADRGEPVSKEKILEDLWPDSDAESAAVIFHTTLYNLRKFLNNVACQARILYRGRQYQLRPGSFTSDRQNFRESVAAGLQAETDPELAIALLEQAVALYRGDYLEEMDYAWLLPQRANLSQLHIEARIRLARHYLAAQDYIRAASQLQAVEKEDPFAEEVHSLLMTAYAKQGNRVAVKKQYQRLRDVLKRELGLEPAPEVSRLYCDLVR